MKAIRLGLVLVSLLIIQVIISYAMLPNAQSQSQPDVYVGVDLAYGSTSEATALIDQVSSYTNFLVVGTSKITGNATRLNETCNYAYGKGLSFVLWSPTGLPRANRTAWFGNAKQAWGDHFLGFYADDEPAGRQLDMNQTRISGNPATYVDAANQFENNLGFELNGTRTFYNSGSFHLFTSDYGLYWFDYKAGYDTLFAEFGWNYSRQFNAAICRGAATVQNKDWGAILLWTYTTPPYLESGSDLYKDMVLAYDNGAKYIVVFDSNKDYTAGILQNEHLQALQQFWQYIQSSPRKSTPTNARTALVLPDGYGYGFRGPGDKIWGLWEADDLSRNLSLSVSSLLSQYGAKLDIIYDDGLQPGNNGYGELIYWNDSSLVQSSTSTSTSSTAPDLSPTPTETPTETKPSDSPPIENPSAPVDYTLPAIAIAVIAGVVVVPAYVFRKKEHCVTFGQTGVGRDYVGTVIVVDGKNYDKYGATFWWDQGSRHTFEFKSPLVVNSTKQYVLASASGLSTGETDVLKVAVQTTVTRNYQLVLKTNPRTRA